MALVSLEWSKVVVFLPDTSCVPFVAKMQKARTRKYKDYFVLRATVPKDVAEKIDARPGDYLFFRAKKAQWYHMLDWRKMGNTWKMLPDDIRNRVIMDGLYCQGAPSQAMTPREITALGATNLSAPIQQIVNTQTNQNGDVHGSSV
jgi:hypothetical protein